MTADPMVDAVISWLASADALAGSVVGAPSDGTRYRLARWVFLRALALIHLAAFTSLWVQLDGLLGRRGILPVADYLDTLGRRPGSPPYRRVPTLFWLSSSDRALHLACAGGVVASLLLLLNVAPAPVLLILWALYLSFAAVGQVFLSYQWDVLLLETTFLAVPLAPWELLPGMGSPAPVPRMAVLLLWWLLFRLNFQSGVGKLTSGDPSWRDLTAMDYHFWTQPLPTWPAWWADKLPAWMKKASTAGTHLLEIGFPFLIFGTRETRLAALGGIVFLQLLIFVTGNYNFFNLLTIALALLLVPDGLWAPLLPDELVAATGGASGPSAAAVARPGPLVLGLSLLLTLVWTVASLPRVWQSLRPTRGRSAFLAALLRPLEPFRTINSYGLFRVMTKERPEIVVEGSRDGQDWEAYEFRWKPGDPTRRPRFCEPHQPRLDWQMWFAALGRYRENPWFRAFLARLLEGSEPVLRLLEHDPFPGDPPRFIRARLYRYRFTNVEAWKEEGRWWERELMGRYSPVLDREEIRT